MKIHSDYLTLHTKQKRELFIITPNVQAAVEKSGIQDGFALVSSLHTNSGVFVNDQEAGLLEDVLTWIETLAPHRDGYKHRGKFESNAGAHLQSLLLNQQALVPVQHGKLELGPWQQVIYADLDGGRPKRILLRVLGE